MKVAFALWILLALLGNFQLAESVGRKRRYVPSDVDIEQTPSKRTGVLKRNTESEISEECSEGSVQVDNQCTQCSPGSYASGGVCVECPKGTYQTQAGQTFCTSCSAGTSTISVGSSSSDMCIVVCTVPEVDYGTSNPPANYDIAAGSNVAITCDSTFKIGGSNTFTTVCADKLPSCSYVTTAAENNQVILGTTGVITCRVKSGDVPSSCLWYKNGIQVLSGNSVVSSDGDNHECTLTLPSFSSSDVASYQCRAIVNDKTVIADKSISTGLLEMTYDTSTLAIEAGKSATLTCAVSNPDDLDIPVEIQWVKDEGVLGSPTTLLDNPGVAELELNSISLSDTAEYSCIASYQGIGVITSQAKPVFVRAIKRGLVNKYTRPGVDVVLTCVCVGDQQASVSWKENYITVSNSESISTSYNPERRETTSTLTLSSVPLSKDNTNYRCEMTMTETVLGSGAQLIVTDDEGVVIPPKDRSGAEGETVTFTCTFGNPAANTVTKAEWYKVSSSGDVKQVSVISQDLGNTQYESKLLLTDLSLSDKGEFYCKATYSDNTVTESDRVTLFVQGFETSPTVQNPKLGESASFTCVSSGGPATITWRLGDNQIPGGALSGASVKSLLYDDTTQTQKSVLTITSASADYEGLYRCAADFGNSVTAESTAAPLVIYDISVEPEFGILGSTVTLTCTIKSDRPERVDWTKDQNVIADSNAISDYSEFSKTTVNKITLSNLKESDFGSYGCISYYNSLSTSLVSPGVPLTQLKVLSVSESQVLTEGESTALICSVSQPAGLPGSALISWTKDGVSQSGQTTTEGTTRTLTLTLSSLTLSKTGHYKCTATYPGIEGSLETENISLFVRGWIIPVGQNYVVSGQSGAITCVAQTESEPVVSWYIGDRLKGGAVTVYKDNIMTSVYTVGVITSQQTVECRATVSGVTIDSSGTVGVLNMQSYQSQDITLVAGSTGQFTCTYDDAQNPSTIWYKNGVALPSDQDTETSSNSLETSTLSLSTVNVDDRGTYSCAVTYPASDGFTGGVMKIKPFTVFVSALWESPKDLSTIQNSEARLTCAFISGAQADTITWKTGSVGSWSDVSQELSTKTYNSLTMVTKSILTFSSLSTNQYGQYKCEAAFGGTTVESQVATITETASGFTTVSGDTSVQPGESVTLTCDGVFSNTADISVTWLKDGEAATSGVASTSDVTSSSTKYKYTITSTSLTDSGKYECAMSFTSTATTVKSLNIPLYVRGFSESPSFQMAETEGETTMSCVVVGDYPTSLTWLKDDNQISMLDFTKKMTTTVVDSSTTRFEIYLFNLVASDAGSYKCRAAWSPENVQIESAEALLLPVEVAMSDQYGIVGSPATLACVGISPGGNVPTLSIYRGETLLTRTDAPQLTTLTTDNYNLKYVISSVSEPDFSDQYSCTIEYGSVSATSELSELEKIEVLSSSAPQSVAYGDSVTLTCTSTLVSSTDVTTTWKKGQESIASTNEGSAVSVYKASLELETVNDNDAGTYQCSMSYSGIGVLNSPDIILGIDSFKTHPEDTVMFAGNELALSCLIKSNVAIRWRKDGNLVSESDFTSVQGSSESSSVLKYSKATAGNSGSYLCEAAVNGKVINTDSAVVTVYEFENSPTFKKVVVGSAATLSCSVRSIPTSPVLTWEKDGAAFTRSELVTDTSDSNSKSSKLVLSSTTSGDLGMYRCKAEFPSNDNFAGGLLYSEESALIVLYISMETAASASKGDSLTLTATLINDKEVDISWSKDGLGTISQGNGVTITQTVEPSGDFKYIKSYLKISSFGESDVGSYTASATATFNGNNLPVSNPQGSRVDLSNIFLSNGFVRAGEEVTMYCMYEGSATVSSYTYQKQDSQGTWVTLAVDTDPDKTSTFLSAQTLADAGSLTGKSDATSGNALTIRGVGSSDAGLYRCSVTDTSALTTTSPSASLQLLSQSMFASKMLVETGEAALITCTFTGPSVPAIEGQTFRNSGFSRDEDALIDSTSQTTSGNSITTKAVFTKIITKNGPFKCFATFTDESSPNIKSTIESDQIEILTASIELGTHEDKLPVYVGAAFTFICQYNFETVGSVAITPAPSQTVSDDSTDNGLTTGYKNGLFGTISESTPTGPYSCTVEIEGHSISKELRLQILPVPPVPSLEETTVQYNDYTWLTCVVESDLPLYTVSWFFSEDDGQENYVTTHRSQDGNKRIGVSERVYGREENQNREYVCKKTIAASLYASEVSFPVKRVLVKVGDVRQFGVSSNQLYVGDSLTVTCTTEEGSTARLYKSSSEQTISSSSSTDNGVITYKYVDTSVTVADSGEFYCEIKRENRWNVYLGPELVTIRKRCDELVNPNPSKATLSCSSDTQEVGSTCTYTCNGDNSMSSRWGDSITTTCRDTGYWSHTYLSSLRLEMPVCSALIEPVTYKAVMVVTFSGITCPPDRSDEIFDIITEEKFRDVDMRGFQNTLVSTQNFYTTDKCKVKWLVEFDGTQADRSPEDLRAVVAAERTALYGKKRFAAEEEESDRDESTFQVECPPGSGISSEDLYCVQCGAGTYSTDNYCVSCPIGSYQDEAGQSSCKKCVGDKSTLTPGSTACLDVCEVGTVMFGTTDPPAGYRVEAGSNVVTTCDQGYFVGTATSVTHECGATQFCSRVLMTSGYEGYASKGHRYSITCQHTTDNPTAELTWYQDNTPLDCDNSGCDVTAFTDSKTTTSVLEVTVENNAEYTCKLGTTPADHNHHVTVLENDIGVSTNLLVGNTYTFTCVGVQPEGVDLPPTMSAFINEKEVFNGELSDNGLTLEVEFQATSDISITCEFLYIQVDQDIFVTADSTNELNIIGVIEEPPRDMFIPLNTNYDITCSMHNVDSISVVKVNDQGVEQVVSNNPSGGSTTFTLTSSTPVSADYYCRGTKDGNSEETTRRTLVVAPTKVVTGPIDQFTVGGRVTFDCVVPAGTTVSFKKSDSPSLDLSSKTTENSESDGNTRFTLTFGDPTESDDGEYFCEGNDGRSTGAMLNFVRILSSPKDLFRDEGQSATFVCSASGIVNIKWSTPDGNQDPDHTFVTESGNTVAELVTTATKGGYFYCVAQDIKSSESARLVVMKVSLVVPDAVKADEEVVISCTVYGDHDGVTLSNEGRVLPLETPSDAMSTMASGQGTVYTATYQATLDTFTEGVSDFGCHAYYNNFVDIQKEESVSHLVGFYQQPSDVLQLTGVFNLVAHISSSPSDEIKITLYNSENDQQATKTLPGGSQSVGFQLNLDVSQSDTYYYRMEVNGETFTSNSFTITSYGAPVKDNYEIYYPGGSLDSLTLTCLLRMPYESPVTWTNGVGEAQGSDNPLISTSYSEEEEILTSTYTISQAGTGYSCSATILEERKSVGYKVYLQNYALVPTNKNEVFYDNSNILLSSSPASFSPTVFDPDGTEIDISQPLDLYKTRDFISVIEWNLGDEVKNFYQTETVNVAGIYISEPASAGLLAGEKSDLLCTATQTADIFAKRITWKVPDGTLTSDQKTLSLGTQPGSGVSETSVTWRSSLTSGSRVTITCTVDFSFKDGSPDITKSNKIVVTIDTKCDTTWDLDNGVITPVPSASRIKPSEVVKVKCNTGYQLSGQSEYTCSGGKLWETPPTCIKKKTLCPSVAPTSAAVTYNHPLLLMKCLGSFSPFRSPPALQCLDDKGWNLLDKTNPVSDFRFCGAKVTPYSKSVIVAVTYDGGSPDCAGSGLDAEGKKTAAFNRYEAEVDLGLNGITASLVSCEPTADGYELSVKYTVGYIHLSKHEYLDLEALQELIMASDGDTSNKRAISWTFDSLRFTYDLKCPLGAPAYLDQCVECPAGFFSTGTACVECPKGEYQHEPGKTYCIACPAGLTTPGSATTTSAECGEVCQVPDVKHGATYPLEGSAITDNLGVTIQCSVGFSPAFGRDNSFSCDEFAALDDSYEFCQEICVVPASMVSEEHVDIQAATTYLPGEDLTKKCVEGYSVKSDSESELLALTFTCMDGDLQQLQATSGYCKKDGLSGGMIVLIIVLVIILLLIICLIPLCCYWMKKNKERDYESEDDKDIEMRPESAFSCSKHVIVRSKDDSGAQQIGNSNPFKVSGFNDYIRTMAVNKNEGFIKEFRSICVGSDTKKIVSQLSENYDKNRYGTITTYDHSRVRLLKINNDPNSDYINASYINGYVTPNAYIATQGPLDNTVNDFWRMIWEQNVSSVVMLTNLEQGGQKKSVKYWPDDSEEQYGVVKVTKQSENKFPGFLVRELKMEVEGSSRTVLQFHYTEWPDVGYPVETKFLTFLYYIRYMRQDSRKPLVVHCSAGAGWTGVFIGMDFTLDRLTKEDTIDVLGCVNSMRQQRSAMVQNEPQYIYLHKLLLDSVNGNNFNRLRANRFRSNLEGAIFVNEGANGINEYEAGI